MGEIAVTPGELRSAGSILSSVGGELAAGGSATAGSIGAGAVGHETLAAALGDYLTKLEYVTASLTGVVSAAADRVTSAGDAYEATDRTAVPGR